ncbi:hypothetical protein, partial [Klebsiella pneumoniae]|uniref:hypothetical protein n=1 Tax=Klebsiella pneumoniae TaxID=573 RepID=UPI001CDC2D5E
ATPVISRVPEAVIVFLCVSNHGIFRPAWITGIPYFSVTDRINASRSFSSAGSVSEKSASDRIS